MAALLLIISHDCLIGVAHAAALAETTSHDAHPGQQGVDRGDCEVAAVKAPIPTVSSPLAAENLSLSLPAAVPVTRAERPAARHLAEPPLFLLHASLLI
ncbi:MAG: hypothetical protein HY574_07935 [candidate division NC10 bacterium]|nr:hypothetical protein [candidate division NC10 bacterium]